METEMQSKKERRYATIDNLGDSRSRWGGRFRLQDKR
jgi:hypothetical protein